MRFVATALWVIGLVAVRACGSGAGLVQVEAPLVDSVEPFTSPETATWYQELAVLSMNSIVFKDGNDVIVLALDEPRGYRLLPPQRRAGVLAYGLSPSGQTALVGYSLTTLSGSDYVKVVDLLSGDERLFDLNGYKIGKLALLDDNFVLFQRSTDDAHPLRKITSEAVQIHKSVPKSSLGGFLSLADLSNGNTSNLQSCSGDTISYLSFSDATFRLDGDRVVFTEGFEFIAASADGDVWSPDYSQLQPFLVVLGLRRGDPGYCVSDLHTDEHAFWVTELENEGAVYLGPRGESLIIENTIVSVPVFYASRSLENDRIPVTAVGFDGDDAVIVSAKQDSYLLYGCKDWIMEQPCERISEVNKDELRAY